MKGALALLAIAALHAPAFADGDPVARLAPVWSESLGVGPVVIDRGQLIALTSDLRDLRSYELADGYAGVPAAQLGTIPIALAVSGSQIVTAMRDEISAWKRTPLDIEPTELWTFEPKSTIEAFAADGERGYAEIFDGATPPHRALIGLSLATGKQVWRLELPATATTELLAAEPGTRGVIAGHISGTATDTAGERTFAIGFDRATGAQQWQHVGASSSALAANRHSLLIARADALTILDRFTGHAFDTPLPVVLAPQLAVTDELAVLAGPSDGTGYVVAVDLATRRTQIVARTPVMPSTPIAIGAGVIFVETPGGVLRALDRFTGALRWQWSIGNEVALRSDGDRLIATSLFGITVFAPGVPPPLQDAVIHGSVELECGEKKPIAILVGDTPVTTAADGTFTVRVRARGTVGIRFAAPADVGGGVTVVPLIGHTRYRATTLQGSVCTGD